MFARRRRRMNRQAQEQDDFEFCTCDVCMRELRRAAEKEALEAAAKQRLMPGAFPSDGQDAGKWIKDLTDGSTNFPSRFFPSNELHTDRVHKILQSHGLYEEQLDVIRYRVSTGNVVKFGPGATIEGVYFPPTGSIEVTGIPLDRPHSAILEALKETLEEGKRVGEDISISDVRRAPNSPHKTATIHIGNRDPKQIMSKLDGVELFGRNISSRLFTAAYPNQMEDVSPTERNVVYIHWRAPEMAVTATFKTSASAIAWCEEHDYSVIDGRTIRAKAHRSLMSHFRKVVEIRNLPLNVNQQKVQELLPDATSVSFRPRNAYNVDRAFKRLRKDVGTIAGRELRDYREDKSKVPSGWLGIRVQCYTWHPAQNIRDSLSQRRRWYIGGHQLFVALEEPYRYSISIEHRQYRAQRKLLHSIWDARRGSPLADIRIITGGPVQDVRIEVYGSNELAVGVLKAHVEGVLKGQLISGCHSFFESNQKLESIRDISVETGCFVRLNTTTQTITTFGDDDTLRAFSERLRLHIDNAISFEIKLTNSAVSAFYLRRGIPLLGSVVGKENVRVTMEHPHSILTVRGGGDEVAHMLSWLCDESIEDVESTSTPLDTMCPVCLDYPEASIRLQCGHLYCYPCLKHFLTTGITDRNSALTCMECLTPIQVNTLRKILPRSELEDLFELAFHTHVRTNPEKFKFCGTPHCTRLYQLAPKDSEDPPAFHCPSCLRSVCSACQGVPHEGVTCFEWGINQNAEVQKADALLEKWAGRKGRDVHRCPKCNAMIEKNKGCNHIRCHCGAHICWACVQSFPDADSVYNHIRLAH
ncbi:hypothetical protein BDM02DRAFT_857977 [Thelephora ganbajun]|uniref:Uncharacterized protein n=1 Tax=Thelephora ganbajun TaxID=370292 RepID=A0ACB6ZPI8_THEGA|nr:hypothetical protein BDM02DRAFT_857977 [Thelephora ganbajun]